MPLNLEEQFIENVSSLIEKYGDAEFIITVSAGMDSMTALYLFKKFSDTVTPIKFVALHVNHNIALEDDEWERFCIKQCKRMGVPLIRENVFISGRILIDGAARDERYRVIGNHSNSNTFIVTAHHANDSAESILMSLQRGAGLDGLSGISRLRPSHNGLGMLYRPLLSHTKAELKNYAVKIGVEWVEDPSNKESIYARNKIRNGVLFDLIEAGGDHAVHRITTAGDNCHSAATAIESFVSKLFCDCAEWDENHPDALPAHLLEDNSTAPFVFRHWLKLNGLFQMPNKRLTTEALRQLVFEFKCHHKPVILIRNIAKSATKISRRNNYILFQ